MSEVGSTPVTLLDFHEDGDGGSGGSLVQGQMDGNTLRLTETEVSPGSNSKETHFTTVTEIELRVLTRVVVETKAASLVVSAVPKGAASAVTTK